MRIRWAHGVKVGVYLLFITLLLSLLLVDAPWEAREAATGGTLDAPALLSPTQDKLFHNTNVTLKWQGLDYEYTAEIFTNGTQQNSSLGPLTTDGETGMFTVSGLDPGTHDHLIIGLDSADNQRILVDEILWLGSPGHDAVINASDGSVITPAQPSWAPLFWEAQPNTTYEVTINTVPIQTTPLNITIDHELGYARVENLVPGKRYSYQVDQVTPQPETGEPIFGDIAIFEIVGTSTLEFQLRHYSYTLEIARQDDPGFTAPLATYTGLQMTHLDLNEVQGNLPELGASYLWRVRASDNIDHTTGWSAVGSFSTGTTNHLGQELLENWGATVMILGGVMLATMVGGIFLAKDEDQQPILPEYTAEDVLTAIVPIGLPASSSEEVDQ